YVRAARTDARRPRGHGLDGEVQVDAGGTWCPPTSRRRALRRVPAEHGERVLPRVLLEHSLPERQRRRLREAPIEREHGMVRSEEDLVLPARVHELDQLGREVLRRVGRGHQVEVGVLEKQPDRLTPPGSAPWAMT